ncbi:hypothetical protein QA447_14320 [Pseudomonas sp. abacavir_1]
MPDIREEFEAWAEGEKLCLHRGMMGGYYLADTAAAWKAWQASRAALVIEMPPRVTAEDVAEHLDIDDQEAVEITHMVNGSIAACAAFIKQAGIEVK